MMTNNKLTIYHKGFDETRHIETWTRFNYNNAWVFGGKGASINKGYDNANDIDVRISYELNNNLDINNFAIGDIIVPDELNDDITTQRDLQNYMIYNITSINNNTFGDTPHIHLGGK